MSRANLTPRMREVLEYLDTDEGDGDMISERGEVWFGDHRTSRRILNRLIEIMAVGVSSGGNNGFEADNGATYWRITDLGKWFLVDEERALGFLREGFTKRYVEIPTPPSRKE